MTLDITPVSGDDPEAIAATCAVIRAVRDHDMPKWRDLTPRMVQLWLTVSYPDKRFESHLAWQDGKPVAWVMLQITTKENLANLYTEIWVDPRARRRGLGRRMHEFVVGQARRFDRTRLLSRTQWELPGIPAVDLSGARFAEALGYSSALPEVVRRLDLSKVDENALEVMHAKARAKAGGYRVVQWNGLHPEEFIDDLAYLDSRLTTDAPMGDLQVEASKVDSERVREFQAAAIAAERQGYHTAAVHEATNRLVAWTTIAKDKSLDWNAFQQITIVDPDHRGHRLGALIKVENLRRLRAAEPSVWAVDTFNADENKYMVSINEEMGFRPLYAFQNWQREI